MERKPPIDIEEFRLLAELNRRAEQAVAEARRLCEIDRRLRAELRRSVARLQRNVSIR